MRDLLFHNTPNITQCDAAGDCFCGKADELTLDDAPVGFGLVCGAGGATMIGAVIVFIPWCIERMNSTFLAGALALAAGVMTYVSMIEIFVKSNDSFKQALNDGYSYCDDPHEKEKWAYLYATLCFFGGVIFNACLGLLTDLLDETTPVQSPLGSSKSAMPESTVTAPEMPMQKELDGCSQPSSERFCSMGSGSGAAINTASGSGVGHGVGGTFGVEDQHGVGVGIDPFDKEAMQDPETQKALMKMGLRTALAIAIHNFPEGLATFVGTLEDSKVGAALAIAIGIHNIPEGLCVAMPVYYATGSALQAFAWAALSGVSEIVGAGLGWGVLYNVDDMDFAYGALFGIVGGMMVHISIKDLFPTALRYDKTGWVTVTFFFIGMAIMALSLVLFQYA
jgi:ZIP family zinc transporter